MVGSTDSTPLMTVLLTLVVTGVTGAGMFSSCPHTPGMKSVYEHSVLSLDEARNISLSEYSGRVLLLVNVATCFTPQYYQLNALTDTHPDDDFAIVAFPCNQFAHQEPGENRTEILNGLRYVRPGKGFIPGFDIMMKIEVNGPKEDPFYTYIKTSCPSPTATTYDRGESFWTPIKVNDISWNFEKILVDRTGRPRFRFLPDVEPNDIQDMINVLLAQPSPAREAELLSNALKTLDSVLKDRTASKHGASEP
ncbi:glutathione peroxidase-like [Liolophura sinensis]|uniref:glutathione peroxidase-like n=1 Tax=Liolophura sinensis TaxID=3198878 RepID=UPI0031583DBF